MNTPQRGDIGLLSYVEAFPVGAGAPNATEWGITTQMKINRRWDEYLLYIAHSIISNIRFHYSR